MLDSLEQREWSVLIGGELQPAADGRRYPTYNPASGEHLATVPDCDRADIDAAVASAHVAAQSWRTVPLRERAAVVRRVAAILREHRSELAQLDAVDGGFPVAAMHGDVDQACDYIEAMADLVWSLTGDTLPIGHDGLHYTVFEPFGVVARINPYNHPLLFTAAKVAAPLIAGNAVVVKVPQQTPLSPLRFGELVASALPPGCLNIVTGSRPDLGRHLVRHRDVRRIAFTGSDVTGRAIQADAASVGVKVVTLELGGKNALIALPDADPLQVAAGAFRGMNLTTSAGQSCGSTSRLVLHRSHYADVLTELQRLFAGTRVGDPLAEATQMGPVVSAEQHEKVLRYISLGIDDGAKLEFGGGRPEGLEGAPGFFVAPTMFSGVDMSMRLAREEVFGPVVSLLRYDTEQEAVDIANSVSYGLTASIWTNDLRAAHRLARDVQAGYVWVNETAAHYFGAPFGGFKDSGVGREESVDELRGYCLTKAVHIPIAAKR